MKNTETIYQILVYVTRIPYVPPSLRPLFLGKNAYICAGLE